MIKPEDGHEFDWNDNYTGKASDYLEPDAGLLKIIDELKPGRALDIGCGSGGLVAALVERGWEVTGVDVAPRAIAAARKVLEARGLQAELHVADAAEWRPTGQYDLITNSFALPTTQQDQVKVLRMARGALTRGGTVVVKDFDASMKRHKQFAPYHCPTVDELRAAFEGLNIVRAEVVETPAHSHGQDGHDQGGPWTAALLVARNPLEVQLDE
jgi:SAM-dependent methyltransferase